MEVEDFINNNRTFFFVFFLSFRRCFRIIDLIAIVPARKAKSRAQLTTMRTTMAYRGTKLFFLLDARYIHHTLTLSRRILLTAMQSAIF